ncbi:PQQ-binding-like beta-propeller repeat protein [Polymorphospora sp. NPDC050346]|uniref:outer membrane protein assembly factor BamB family protein n=1 Tax=Polymorphospora sp. NPDC050346 TaxID=3155780 RepID=UPI003411C717
MSSGTVIDLGTRDHELPAEPEPPRPVLLRHLRTAVAALAALLVLATAGSGPLPEPALVEVAVLTTAGTHQQFLVGDRLYVLAPEAGGVRLVLTAYDLDRDTVLWTAPVGPEVRVTDYPRPAAQLRPVDGQLLVHINDGTTAVDDATGRTRWSVPHPITDVRGGGVGLSSRPVWSSTMTPADRRPAVVGVFDPATGAVTESAPPPDEPRRFQLDPATGTVIAIPPAGMSVRAFDLADGAELWTADLVRSGVLLAGAATPTAAVVTMDGGIELRDARTGATRHRRPAEPDRPATSAVGAGGLVLVRDTSPAVNAYDAETLEPVWRTPVRPDEEWALVCGTRICVRSEVQTSLLDPMTGVLLGRVALDGHLTSRGGHLIALASLGEGFVDHTVDPATGERLVSLSAWPKLAVALDDSPAVLTRFAGGPRRLWFAVLDPGATAVRPLGVVAHRSYGCQSSRTHIVCRTRTDELRAWRYR